MALQRFEDVTQQNATYITSPTEGEGAEDEKRKKKSPKPV